MDTLVAWCSRLETATLKPATKADVKHWPTGAERAQARSLSSPLRTGQILGNATDLAITEHAANTHGANLLNFAPFDLVGLQLSPRVRDLGKFTLYRGRGRTDVCEHFPSAGPR